MTSFFIMEKPSHLHVIIPGFGNPHLEDKLRIFKNNLRVLSYYPEKVSITVCIYDKHPETQLHIQEIIQQSQSQSSHETMHVRIIQQEGIVGGFIKKYAHPDDLKSMNVDYVLLLLDDVELMVKDGDIGKINHHSEWKNIWTKLLYDYQRHHMDIASPSMTHDSKYLFPHMLHQSYVNSNAVVDTIRIVSACEFFCYFMRLEIYERYYQQIHETHPWMWGIDLVLTKHLGFCVGIVQYLQMKHYYQNTSTYNDAQLEVFEKMNQYLATFGETQQSLALQPAILEERFVFHRNIL